MHDDSTDVMESEEEYEAFYESLGKSYPESQVVYEEALGRARRAIVRSYLERFSAQGLTLLDVGCNSGEYTLFYASLGREVWGIDISRSLVATAVSRANQLNLRNASFEVANVETYRGGPYDAILFSEVLEHLRNPATALESLARCLRPGGFLLLTTPAPIREDQTFASFVMDRLLRRDLVRAKVHKSEGTRIREYVSGAYHYRHDEYYPIPLACWVATFGFRCVRAGSFFTTERYLRHLNRVPRLQSRMPLISLLGLNNLHLFERIET